jgi:hypothetical protein
MTTLCHYVTCHVLFILLRNVTIIMLIVVKLNTVVQSVMAPSLYLIGTRV